MSEYLHFYKKEDVDKLLLEIKDGKISIEQGIHSFTGCCGLNGNPTYLGINVTIAAGSGMMIIKPIEKNNITI